MVTRRSSGKTNPLETPSALSHFTRIGERSIEKETEVEGKGDAN